MPSAAQALFLQARRQKTTVFLEPNASDTVCCWQRPRLVSALQVQSVVDLIAGLMKQRPEDVAVVFQGKRLDNSKKLEDCNVSAHGQPIVEPIDISFVFKKEGSSRVYLQKML